MRTTSGTSLITKDFEFGSAIGSRKFVVDLPANRPGLGGSGGSRDDNSNEGRIRSRISLATQLFLRRCGLRGETCGPENDKPLTSPYVSSALLYPLQQRDHGSRVNVKRKSIL